MLENGEPGSVEVLDFWFSRGTGFLVQRGTNFIIIIEWYINTKTQLSLADVCSTIRPTIW